MAVFGVDKKELDDFKTRQEERFASIQVAIASLQKAIDSKVTDSEIVAKTAAENAAQNQQKTQEMTEQIRLVVAEIEQAKLASAEELSATRKFKTAVESLSEQLSEKLGSINTQYASFLSVQDKINSEIEELSAKIQSVDSYLKLSAQLPIAIEEANKSISEVKNTSDTIKNTLAHAVSRKSDIDELHKKILGENITNEDGKTEHVDGIKDELEKTYRGLSDVASNLDATISNLTGETTKQHETLLIKIRTQYDDLLKAASDRYAAVNLQLTGLLPGAMAEGLSAAYEKKKLDEEASLTNYEKNFKNAIQGLVVISLIPLAVDLYLLAFAGKDLVQVIKDTPSLIVAILPLYFPVLWLAYSSNKRLNLSKRLIEEYTHKLVLGKTFSGLSNQIDTLSQQDEIKDELRTRLLFNVLQVSAENPGKLISNYNKSDHPLMEAIENSTKLSDSVEKLAKIPGFSALAKKLADKSDVLLKAQADKVVHGLDAQNSLDNSKLSPAAANSTTNST
jgi:hypothetical protein